MTRRKGPTPARPWQPLTRKVLMHKGQVIDPQDPRVSGRECFGNDLYTVVAERLKASDPELPDVIHLSLHRHDRKAIVDWRHLQRIKNEIVGPECEGIQIHPAESRLVDTSNEFHLWVIDDPNWRLPFGFDRRMVMDHDPDDETGAVQRPLDPDTCDVTTPQEYQVLLREQWPELAEALYNESHTSPGQMPANSESEKS